MLVARSAAFSHSPPRTSNQLSPKALAKNEKPTTVLFQDFDIHNKAASKGQSNIKLADVQLNAQKKLEQKPDKTDITCSSPGSNTQVKMFSPGGGNRAK